MRLPLAIGLVLLGHTFSAQTPVDEAKQQLRLNTLQTVWQRVQDHYYDPTFNGVNWAEVKERYTLKLTPELSDSEYYDLLNDMLKELKRSHFGVIPPKAYAAEEEAAKRGTGANAGMTLQIVEGLPTITRIEAGSAAQRANLKVGFLVEAIDKTNLAETWKKIQERPGVIDRKGFLFTRVAAAMTSGKPGQIVKIVCVDGNNKRKTVPVKLTKERGMPMKFGELPTMFGYVESRRLEANIGYVSLSVFMMPLLDQVKRAIASFHDCKALIIDLRQNPGGVGGMAIPIAGVILDRQVNLGTMKMRVGETNFVVYPQPNAFKGPVAILIDESSASTSEIFAAGLQECGRAVVVGQQSAGAALPSMVEKLPDGARLQYAFADFKTPKGTLIEGRGVIPDYPVRLTRKALLSQKDPVIQKAVSVLSKMATNKGKRP